jgi:hypothetical protein
VIAVMMSQFPAVDVLLQGLAAKACPDSRTVVAAVSINARLFKANLSLISGPADGRKVLTTPPLTASTPQLATAGGAP